MEALAEVIARASIGVKPARLLHRPNSTREPLHFDGTTRHDCLRRIRFLAKSFELQWLVEQATFGRGSAEMLEDCELASLLLELERARECARDGISLDDAGFVRDMSANLARTL